MLQDAKWIKPTQFKEDVNPLFQKSFSLKGAVSRATLSVTALGVYEASLNGHAVGEFALAPGWTSYDHRIQYQEYDVTDLLDRDNHLEILVGKGWFRSRLVGWETSALQDAHRKNPPGLMAGLQICYTDGREETISTDHTWTARESAVLFSEIYDGEIYDASFQSRLVSPVEEFQHPIQVIPQQGCQIRRQEILSPARLFTTPAGELVLDFGQEITGYVEIELHAGKGDLVDLSFAEVLDQNGNFYTHNYRSAKSLYQYTCRDGLQTYHPKFTFYGFRYVRINRFPGGLEKVSPSCFRAVVLHSQMERTGYIRTSHPLLNRLFENIVWGQKGNFLDVPTDCPQRDERLGWTGDAQAFVRTACLNFDTERFFTKWLRDMALDQREDGCVGHVIPDLLQAQKASAAWGDAATICPWEVYLAYGNIQILEAQFDSMCKWIGYISSTTQDEFLWTGGEHFGDWLGLDAPSGSYKGSSREDLIASAFYAHSTQLVIKAGRALKRDVDAYEDLYRHIVDAFRKAYPTYQTQTECVLALHFHLAQNPKEVARQLADMIEGCGTRLQTGFVGTPYLLHVLSENGYTPLAYSLLLRTQYPSWLYPVTKGATTIWEHWDGIMEDGGFWSPDMNSFNHYAYGAVADWMYGICAGIQTVEAAPGYEKIRIVPHPDSRLDWLEASVLTRRGLVSSRWSKQEGRWRYDITTPSETQITLGGTDYTVSPGSYVFWTDISV